MKFNAGDRVISPQFPLIRREIVSVEEGYYLWRYPDLPTFDTMKNIFDSRNSTDPELTQWEIEDKAAYAIALLKELCRLKHYKDTVGKDLFYKTNLSIAWNRASIFLDELAQEKSVQKNEEAERVK